ncbi:MAG TPA: patatin-like phospholipase family protein, partial [Solirubrobacteraceae bacterium]|nr:patatin-like phospholipase family protein [Solirubrobacteraceae bacterium]
MSTEDRPHRVGLVLAGGGARGAYEMGVLSVLLPFLESRGERPSIFVGTSVGAINAAAMASTAHLPAEEAVEVGMARWREVEPRSVLRSLVGSQVALVALRYAGEIARVPGVRLQSLLDPAPLHDNLERWVDWAAMRANLDGDQLCLGVVTTAARSGRSVVFVDGCLHEERHRSHLMDYVPAEIGPLHIQASAAIPLLFPSVRIEEPESARGWYVDGGTRL